MEAERGSGMDGLAAVGESGMGASEGAGEDAMYKVSIC